MNRYWLDQIDGKHLQHRSSCLTKWITSSTPNIQINRQTRPRASRVRLSVVRWESKNTFPSVTGLPSATREDCQDTMMLGTVVLRAVHGDKLLTIMVLRSSVTTSSLLSCSFFFMKSNNSFMLCTQNACVIPSPQLISCCHAINHKLYPNCDPTHESSSPLTNLSTFPLSHPTPRNFFNLKRLHCFTL